MVNFYRIAKQQNIENSLYKSQVPNSV